MGGVGDRLDGGQREPVRHRDARQDRNVDHDPHAVDCGWDVYMDARRSPHDAEQGLFINPGQANPALNVPCATGMYMYHHVRHPDESSVMASVLAFTFIIMITMI